MGIADGQIAAIAKVKKGVGLPFLTPPITLVISVVPKAGFEPAYPHINSIG